MLPTVALSAPMIESCRETRWCSAITPKPAEWWLRPVISAARVGEQSAVEWNWVQLSPSAAIWSSVGVRMTPPKVPGATRRRR